MSFNIHLPGFLISYRYSVIKGSEKKIITGDIQPPIPSGAKISCPEREVQKKNDLGFQGIREGKEGRTKKGASLLQTTRRAGAKARKKYRFLR